MWACACGARTPFIVARAAAVDESPPVSPRATPRRNLNYWDSVSTLAGEVQNPHKTFPRALAGALGGLRSTAGKLAGVGARLGKGARVGKRAAASPVRGACCMQPTRRARSAFP